MNKSVLNMDSVYPRISTTKETPKLGDIIYALHESDDLEVWWKITAAEHTNEFDCVVIHQNKSIEVTNNYCDHLRGYTTLHENEALITKEEYPEYFL